MNKPSELTIKTLNIRRAYIYKYNIKKAKYKRLSLAGGYTILEYYGVIRKYLQWQYNISLESLELLYYLYGREFFMRKDFSHFPVRWGNKRLQNLIDQGLIDVVFPERKIKHVYRLSLKARYIVKLAHKLLSGEVKMPILAYKNKSFRSDATYSQKKFRSIMQDMHDLVDEKFDYEEET